MFSNELRINIIETLLNIYANRYTSNSLVVKMIAVRETIRPRCVRPIVFRWLVCPIATIVDAAIAQKQFINIHNLFLAIVQNKQARVS